MIMNKSVVAEVVELSEAEIKHHTDTAAFSNSGFVFLVFYISSVYSYLIFF